MMVETLVGSRRKGVLCVFCGTATPLPASDYNTGFALLRCHECGKEAPYPGAYIIDLPERDVLTK